MTMPERTSTSNGGGVWLVAYSDWSGIAIFGADQELEALRYAVENSMSCEFRAWGVIR
jgi:hypothetical protein